MCIRDRNIGYINKLTEITLGVLFVMCITAAIVIKTVSGEKNEETLTTVMNNLTTELCDNDTLESCSSTVDSNMSTEITIASNSTIVTTTELNAVNTTASSTTESPPLFHTHYVPEKDCHCDMTVSHYTYLGVFS